ncbi:MAG: hypothetical protein ACRC3B_23415 [Bacteroidia bacterium]
MKPARQNIHHRHNIFVVPMPVLAIASGKQQLNLDALQKNFSAGVVNQTR